MNPEKKSRTMVPGNLFFTGSNIPKSISKSLPTGEKGASFFHQCKSLPRHLSMTGLKKKSCNRYRYKEKK
jgi:hypothetical protein